MCGTPTSLRVINSIDFKWAIIYHPITFLLLIFVAVIFFMISYCRCGIPTNEDKNNYYTEILKYIIFILFFAFILNCYYGYDPLGVNTNYFSADKEEFFTDFEKFYETEINVSFKNPQRKKNLIIVEMESCEKDILGRFNIKFNKTMPFVSKLTENSTYVDFVGSSMYTDWSVAAMFASQCGLPLIAQSEQGEFHLFKGHRCFGDYMDKLGYNLYSVETAHFVGNFARHLKMHHWETEDITKHGFKHDMDTFRYIISDLFPRMKEPFILHISNTDTHPFPSFYVDPKCKKRVPSSYPSALQSFDCFDQILEEFYNSFKKSKFVNNTEMIMFNDHLLMAGYKSIGILKDMDKRSLNIIIPTRPKKLIQKKASIYDLTPTFFDLIDVNYSPKFLFGESLLSDKIGTGINETYAKYIYDFFNNGKYYIGDVTYKSRIHDE